MAKKRGESVDEVKDAFSSDTRFKSYKSDSAGFDELDEGGEITGILVSIRDQQLKDKRTKQLKTVRVYSIRTDEGQKRISGRTLLDRMADDIMDEHGGYSVENNRYSGPGYDWFCNRAVKFLRGDDTRTGEGNPLGTYEILVEED